MMSERVFDTLKDRLSKRGPVRLWPPYEKDEEVADNLLKMNPQDLTPDIIKQPDYAAATVAGLLLWADCLEESHRLSQEISNTTGSFWHGIMHRREPDYDNARYWFRKVEDHPAFPLIYDSALKTLSGMKEESANRLKDTIQAWGEWNPAALIALVQEAKEENDSEMIKALEAVQMAEISTLLDWTYEQAITGEQKQTFGIA